jgi:hypothetical protein
MRGALETWPVNRPATSRRSGILVAPLGMLAAHLGYSEARRAS